MRALDRVIAILEAVAAGGGSTKPAQAATRAGLSLSTVARVMREMSDTGLLERTEHGAYVLGRRLIAIARVAADQNPLIAVALPEMESLRDTTGETVSLHIQAGDHRVCIAEVQSQAPVRRVVPVGMTLPLHLGATGNVILAHTSPAFQDAYVRSAGLGQTDARALRARLESIKAIGWASAVDAWADGVSGIAAPIFDHGVLVAALSASGPSSRWTEAAMQSHVGDTVEATRRISERLARF